MIILILLWYLSINHSNHHPHSAEGHRRPGVHFLFHPCGSHPGGCDTSLAKRQDTKWSADDFGHKLGVSAGGKKLPKVSGLELWNRKYCYISSVVLSVFRKFSCVWILFFRFLIQMKVGLGVKKSCPKPTHENKRIKTALIFLNPVDFWQPRSRAFRSTKFGVMTYHDHNWIMFPMTRQPRTNLGVSGDWSFRKWSTTTHQRFPKPAALLL